MEIATTNNYSDYIFYADESGDHSLTSIDAQYPVFALSLCAFKKNKYCSRIVPKFQKLKFKYFGHDAIVLHEWEIRKQIDHFAILANSELRTRFMEDLSQTIRTSSFRIFSVVIAKEQFRRDFFPENPYEVSLRVCLELAYDFLKRRQQHHKRTFFIFEKRGKKEDKELELEFFRICKGGNDFQEPFLGFNIIFSDKKSNSTGLQLADLTARPIGLSIHRPDQRNQAFELIRRKIYRNTRFVRNERGIHIP